MTRQKTFKRRVRTRMAKTGESYTAARRILTAEPPPAPVPLVAPAVSEDAAVSRATGRTWEAWFALLDAWDASARPHPEIARWLTDAHNVGGWWAQSITVRYEQARGRRAPGQQSGGWTATASKTVAVPVERLFEAFQDEAWRPLWLPDAPLGLRTATPPRSARYDWGDGTTRVNAGFTALAADKSQVALAHERLADADAVAAEKAYWQARLAALKALLEAASDR